MTQQIRMRKAVVLLSGGLDSITALEIARSQGFEIHTLTLSYGQRHKVELEAVGRILKRHPVQSHRQVELDLRIFGGSALTSEIEVPKTASLDEISPEIPVTYVPARNTIFLSFALGLAETLGAYNIFIGANQLDALHYPDCKEEYLQAFAKMAQLATAMGAEKKGEIQIHAPLIHMNKAQIIQKGMSLGIDYSLTMSCYDPDSSGLACGQCGACHLRIEGFRSLNLKDPAKYRAI
jgi:7-cyano-7-deazaguanine synthase